MMCFFLGVLYIPLGDGMTIVYAGPFFIMIFSFIFLGIKQSLWKISFAIVLMTGVVLVIRPPFLFPEDGSLCCQIEQVFEAEKPENYVLGVVFCISSAAVLGLIGVCIAYLKVRM